MTRLWPSGVPIAVRPDKTGAPGRITWDGRTHQVQTIADHWRVELEWWRGEPVARDYYKVVTRSGLLLVLYRDRNTDLWFLQRLYD